MRIKQQGETMNHPLVLKTIRLYFALLSVLSPSLSVKSAHSLFHTPLKSKRRTKEEKLLKISEQFTIDFDKHTKLQLYRWGDKNAPVILLVHGWSGTATSMSHFIDKLLKAKYQVISYDAIKHGKSTGKLSDICNWADSLRVILNDIGDVECIIAHSLGAGAVTMASNLGLSTKKIVLIAGMQDAKKITDRFAKRFGIPLDIIQKMRQYTWITRQKNLERYGTDWKDVFVSSFKVPTLIIHDQDDKEVSINDAKLLQSHWPWAKLHVTQGLGHRRILYDRSVVKKVVEFVKDKNL